MKKFLLINIFLILGVLFTSCNKNETLPREDISFEEMVNIYTQAANNIKEIIGSNESGIQLAAVSHILSEQQAIEIIEPLTISTASYLKSKYDIDVYDYFYPGDPEISQIGAFTLRVEAAAAEGLIIDEDLFNIWLNEAIQTSSAITRSQWIDCALDALGIPAGMVMGYVAGDATKTTILKAIGKLATKTLGIIGAALALISFTSCMGWI